MWSGSGFPGFFAYQKEKEIGWKSYISGQIIIFHQPGFSWNKVISLTFHHHLGWKLVWGRELIWPDIYIYIHMYIMEVQDQTKWLVFRKLEDHQCKGFPTNGQSLVQMDFLGIYKKYYVIISVCIPKRSFDLLVKLVPFVPTTVVQWKMFQFVSLEISIVHGWSTYPPSVPPPQK